MTKVLVTEGYLGNIADAIRSKNHETTFYRPGDMAQAIRDIDTSGITPTGTTSITENGVHDVTNYASAFVSVLPNLQSKTAMQNGIVTPDSGYDGLSRVVVDVSGGGGGGIFKRLVPLHVDVTGGYPDVSFWKYAPSDVSGRTDVYAVKAGYLYLAVVPLNWGNRFRVHFFSVDVANLTSNVDGVQLYKHDPPSAYEASSNKTLLETSTTGYITIYKTYEGYDGYESFLFEVDKSDLVGNQV